MRTINILIAIFVLLVTAADAATPATGPRSAGEPHACSQFYPFTAAGAEGTTTLAFRIAVEGTTKDISVSKSSGSPDLDSAAVLCVSGWHYAPAISDGNPVEVDWEAKVEWKLRASTNETPPGALQTHVCRNYPHSAVWQGAEGNVIVTFHIGVDGTVKNPAIVKSTGDDDLDRATLTCVAAWRYKPATSDGVAIEVPWQAQVNWMMHGAAMSPCASYAKVTPEMLAGISGVTKVSLRIQQDGSVSDTAILRTSGNGTLDQAALLCMSRMRFDVSRAVLPSTGLVKNVSVNWNADLPNDTKKMAEKQSQDPKAAGILSGTTPPSPVRFSMCGRPAGAASSTVGPTEVSFKVGVDGGVKDIAVTKSSGSQALDNLTLSCVAAWKYTPATKDGRPVEADWSEHMDWQRH